MSPPPGTKTVGKAVGQRVAGDRPNPLHAFGAAVVVGVGTAIVTYKALRK
jgi:hypothetical protein